MNRYLLFSGQFYYPSGGVDDFCGSYATMVECMQAVQADSYWEWWNVLDIRTGQTYDSDQVGDLDRLAWAAGIDEEG